MKKIKKMSTVKLDPIQGSITDTLNIDDKITNAPSIRLVNDILASPINSVLAYDGDDIPEGYEEVKNSQLRLLWANPDMSDGAVMGETDIQLLDDDFDYLIIFFLFDTLSGNRYIKSSMFLKGYAGILDCNTTATFANTSKTMLAHRKFNYPNYSLNDFKTIKFLNAEIQWLTDASVQSWRRACYPTYIYGGKF